MDFQKVQLAKALGGTSQDWLMSVLKGPVTGHEFRVLLDIFRLPIFKQEKGGLHGSLYFSKKWSKRSRQIP